MFNLFNNNCGCRPQMENIIMEPGMTKCSEKEYYQEVRHCCPIHTHVINKHIYTHTYTPEYTCDEENVIINNDCGKCSNF